MSDWWNVEDDDGFVPLLDLVEKVDDILLDVAALNTNGQNLKAEFRIEDGDGRLLYGAGQLMDGWGK